MKVPTLVLLPGMDGTGVLFEPLVEALPKGVETLVVSYPGKLPLSYERLLPLVLRALPTERPYILLGESFSGPLAIMAAAGRPENLKAVILCATFIRNPIPWLPCWSKYIARAPLFYFFRVFLLSKAVVAGYASGGVLTLLKRAHAMVSPSVMAARARAVLGVNVEWALKKIEVPIFFMAGREDRVVPPKNRREILKARPDVSVSLVDGPHLVLQLNPGESASVIRRIVEAVEASG